MRQTTNDLLFQIEECRNLINNCEIVRAKLAIDSPATLRLRDLAVAQLPVNFVLYWGVWQHSAMRAGERVFLEHLESLAEGISRTLRVPCQLRIVATDTHARLNGVPDAVIEGYLGDLSRVAGERGIDIERLSSLVADLPPVVGNAGPPDFQPSQKWQRLRAMLKTQAAKLFVDAEAKAAAYELANLREGGGVLRKYPTGIFLHTGVPELRPLLCSLPTVHIYTGPGRKTRKPWFEGEDEAAGVKAEL